MDWLYNWWAWLTGATPAKAPNGPLLNEEPKDALPVPPLVNKTTGEPQRPLYTGGFERCLPVILKWEGGKFNHPKDPGGKTNKGIIQVRYNEYRRDRGLPIKDVYLITDAEVKEIYDEYYWDVIKGDYIPPGVDLVVFDAAVNSGTFQGAKWLQRTIGAKDDGRIGPMTLKALRETTKTPTQIVNEICDRRMAMLRGLSTWQYFGKGWTNRVVDIRRTALSMVGK